MPLNGDSLSLIGLVVAGLLSVMTLSFVIKDNVLFRLALHLLIGISAGYAGAIAVEDVIFPQLLLPLFNQLSGNPQIDFVDLVARTLLTLLLLTKLFPRTAAIGNPATALLVGVGAALAIAGAVQGSILPQIGAAGNSFDSASLRLALLGGAAGYPKAIRAHHPFPLPLGAQVHLQGKLLRRRPPHCLLCLPKLARPLRAHPSLDYAGLLANRVAALRGLENSCTTWQWAFFASRRRGGRCP